MASRLFWFTVHLLTFFLAQVHSLSSFSDAYGGLGGEAGSQWNLIRINDLVWGKDTDTVGGIIIANFTGSTHSLGSTLEINSFCPKIFQSQKCTVNYIIITN